jgi:glucose-6-phosphate 1-epimerase
MPQTIEELASRLEIPGMLRFEAGPGGLIRARVNNQHTEAAVYLHGAHVAEYRPAGQPEVLFMSEKSLFDAAKPIRGGVPVIFPWFGPHATDPAAGLHGFVRTMPWSIDAAQQLPDGSTRLVLSVADNEVTRGIWPRSFALRFTVNIGPALTMSLEVRNKSSDAFSFEEALHTYFQAGDVRQIGIAGLAGAEYLDRMEGMKRKTEGDEPIRITCETDRVYVNTTAAAIIDDPSLGRRITIEKTGSSSTVVWNPWIDKAKAMPDFGDEEWKKMVCIETVNAKENALRLEPGQTHTMTTVIRSRMY